MCITLRSYNENPSVLVVAKLDGHTWILQKLKKRSYAMNTYICIIGVVSNCYFLCFFFPFLFSNAVSVLYVEALHRSQIYKRLCRMGNVTQTELLYWLHVFSFSYYTIHCITIARSEFLTG